MTPEEELKLSMKLIGYEISEQLADLVLLLSEKIINKENITMKQLGEMNKQNKTKYAHKSQ